MTLSPQDASPNPRRRIAKRLQAQTDVRISIDAGELEGRTENISDRDVLFSTDEAMRVTVRIEDDGVVKLAPGRIMRVETDQDGTTSWAVRFGG
jgi:hypothetical protein